MRETGVGEIETGGTGTGTYPWSDDGQAPEWKQGQERQAAQAQAHLTGQARDKCRSRCRESQAQSTQSAGSVRFLIFFCAQ